MSEEVVDRVARWDERYAGREYLWDVGPNRFVERHLADLPPGTAIDLAAGEGRNAAWLAEKRSIHVVGLDTPSIDHGPSVTFDTHVRLFRSNIPALENLANLDRLPPKGFTVIALPMKTRAGSGGPTRVVALLD